MHLRIASCPHIFHAHTQRDLTPDHVSGQNLKDEEEPSPVTSEVAHHHRFSGRVLLSANLFADGLFLRPLTTPNYLGTQLRTPDIEQHPPFVSHFLHTTLFIAGFALFYSILRTLYGRGKKDVHGVENSAAGAHLAATLDAGPPLPQL